MSNTQIIERESVDLTPRYDGPETSTAALVLDSSSFDSMMRVAEVMATGRSTIPAHLRGNVGDCMAVIMQSMQWQMNPFAVAQKTHLSQSGALGYEAQLISAVITNRAPIKGRPDYEYIGDWSKVLGKCEERKSDKGGKYYVATYTKADEEGLGVIVRATFIGEDKPREVTVMMSQAYPRFSTQWATDPQQQISYLAIRKWGRRYTPDVLLGVYTPDELVDGPREVDITPAGEYQEQSKPASRTDALKARLGAKGDQSGGTQQLQRDPGLLADVIKMIAAAGSGSELHAAKVRIKELTHEQDAAEALQAYAVRVSYLQSLPQQKEALIDRAKSANSDDELNLICDEARTLPDALAQEVYDAVDDRREAI